MPDEIQPQYENENKPNAESPVPPDDQRDNPDYKELLARVEAAEKRAADAEQRSTVGGQPLNYIPEDAGGPGLDLAETWSQAEQEERRAER